MTSLASLGGRGRAVRIANAHLNARSSRVFLCGTQGAVGCQCHLVVDGGLRAYVAPFFTHELEDRTTSEGGTVSLIARVEAYPAVGVLW